MPLGINPYSCIFYRISRPIRRTVIFSLEISEKNDDECILILVIYWKKTGLLDSFGGLVVSILATGTRVRGFKPGRSRWIFRESGKSSVCLPLEGK